MRNTDTLEFLPTTATQALKNIRNFLAGRLVGATRDRALMDEVFKCLFAKHWIKKVGLNSRQHLSEAYAKAFQTAKTKLSGVFHPDSVIELDSSALQYVDQQLESIDFEHHRADIFSEVYEIFGGTGVKSSEGQFFTPRVGVDLLVEMVSPKAGQVVCDPACGAGGFLAAVASKWVGDGVPQKQILDNVWGYDKDSYLARLATGRLALLLDDLPNICCGDSLAKIKSNGEAFTFPECDVVLTNPPFGAKIVAADANTLRNYELARTWRKTDAGAYAHNGELSGNISPQILFLELCLSILKPGGVLGAILPESMVSTASYAHVVHYLKARSEIKAVVGMPEALFKTSGKGGTHTKTVALVAEKLPVQRCSKTIFFAEAKWCGHDSRARQVSKNDIPAILENYIRFKNLLPSEKGHFGTAVPTSRVQLNLAPRAFEFDIEAEVERLRVNHAVYRFGDLVERKVLAVTTGDEVGKLAYGSGAIPFIRTSDISTWEIKFDPKHRVSDEVYKQYQSRQDVKAEDILMVKDGTYLIGTCAIVGESDLPLLYQSHIYKIRVLDAKSLDPYLLLASLSCTFVQRQIKSHSVSQDIIDSLGSKIHELMLPFPRSADKCADISKRVKAALRARAESKSLAQTAMREVVED